MKPAFLERTDLNWGLEFHVYDDKIVGPQNVVVHIEFCHPYVDDLTDHELGKRDRRDHDAMNVTAVDTLIADGMDIHDLRTMDAVEHGLNRLVELLDAVVVLKQLSPIPRHAGHPCLLPVRLLASLDDHARRHLNLGSRRRFRGTLILLGHVPSPFLLELESSWISPEHRSGSAH